MAGEKIGYTYSAYAGADLVDKEGQFVKISGGLNGLPVVSIATDALQADGVILRGDVKDAVVRIGHSGIVMAVAGGNIAASEAVEVLGGKAVKATAGKAVGIAISDAADGDMFPILLLQGSNVTVHVDHQHTGYIFRAVAGADLTGKEGYVVSITGATNGLPKVGLATDAQAIDGVIVTGGAKDTEVEIVLNGVTTVVAEDVIAALAALEAKNGKVITKTTGVTIGKALEAAAAQGDKILALIK